MKVEIDRERIAETGKRQRSKLAKSELWVLLAMTAQRWADDVSDKPCSTTIPFNQWGDDDPHRELALVYGLTGVDLGRILTKIADECETKADHCGYDEAWR